jgi:hypothetical protein
MLFPAPSGPMSPKIFARPHVEFDAANRLDVAVPLGQRPDPDGDVRLGHRRA